MDIDFTQFIDIGIAGVVLLWFMFRLERILGKFDKTMQLMTRAIIRLLERHDADMATQLSKELYVANGDDKRNV